MFKINDKQKKALKDYGLAVLASAVTMGVALLTDMAPQYAIIIGALAAPAMQIGKNAGSEFDFKTGDYRFTEEAMEWCANLETKAKQEVKADDAF